MTKKVVYTTTAKLSCISDTPPPDVVLCLSDPSLLAPQICDGGGDVPYDFTTLAATLTNSWQNCTPCGSTTWSYVFSYDETLLADPTDALLISQIVGVFCRNCLTTYIDEKVGNEVTLTDNGDGTLTLTTQHGCEYTFFGTVT